MATARTDTEYAMREAISQFLRRCEFAAKQPKYDNQKLPAGSSSYFYCEHCGVQTEQLPEDYLFPPRHVCSQCAGLEKIGWLSTAKTEAALMDQKLNWGWATQMQSDGIGFEPQ